jgi:hypothetical protein
MELVADYVFPSPDSFPEDMLGSPLTPLHLKAG